MIKAELITKIAHETGLEKAKVTAVVESFMQNVKDSLVEDKENVYLRGFGSFVRKRRAAKIGRNITAETTIDIPAHDVPYFKPAKEFMIDMLKK